MRNPESLVWVKDEEVFGWIVGGLGAYVTTVWYAKDGIEYEVLLENDEFELREDGPFGYDDDD